MNKKVLFTTIIILIISLYVFIVGDKTISAPPITSTKISDSYIDISVNKPDTENYKEVSVFIDGLVSGFKDEYKQLKAEDLEILKRVGYKYQMIVDTKIASSTNTISFIVQAYRYTGGAHGSTQIKTFVYNLDKKLITENEIFKDSDWRNLISEKSREYFRKELGVYLDENMLSSGTSPDLNNFNNFYISGNNIVFLFEEYSIGPYALGIQEFSVPFDQIRKILKSNILKASVSDAVSVDFSVNPKSENLYSVVRVVDGDTLTVKDFKGVSYKVRMIGVNTPETVDPRKKVECFGKEASAFSKKMLSDKNVILEQDDSQSDKDKYGRLLRYVYLDGVLINKTIIESGFGYEYTYNTPYKFQKEFKDAQKRAEINKVGLWADGVCDR